MPSGKTHDIINIIFIVFVFLIIFLYDILSNLDKDVILNSAYIFIGSYIFSTFMLSPDLDLYKNKSKLNWGFLRWIWYPYSKVFKHRGISHSIVFGILTRLIYLYIVIMIFQFVYLYIKDEIEDINFFIIDKDYLNVYNIISFFLGIYLPSIIHTLADKIYTSVKRGSRR